MAPHFLRNFETINGPQLDFELDTLFAKGEIGDAIALINRYCESNTPAALRWRGFLLLSGQYVKRDLKMARHWLGIAADAGDENAAWLEVALDANGSGSPINWSKAVARLEKLAKTSADARTQAAHISKLRLDCDGYPSDNIALQYLCHDPFIGWVDNFCDEFECRQIAVSGADILEPSTVFDPVDNVPRPDPVRTSAVAAIGPARENIIVAAVLRRIAKATKSNIENGEHLSLLRYSPGQEYRPHLDVIGAAQNQRTTTAIIYLNEGYRGGDTIFPLLDIAVKPRAGGLLVFNNLADDGSIERRSLHAGTPVVDGTKWAATRWIRKARYDAWNII